MAKKKGIRAKGSGSIYQEKSGAWVAAVVLGRDPQTGRYRRKYRRAKTEREAVQLLNMMMPLVGSAFTSTPRNLLVKDWLLEYAKMRAPDLRPRTRENHQYYVRRVDPVLGGIHLAKLSAMHVRELYAGLAGEGLSPSVRQHIHHFLHSALEDAVRLGILAKSPMEAVDRPKSGRVVKAAVWDRDQARKFLDLASGHRLYGAFYLMLACGMRVGEVLALEWRNIGLVPVSTISISITTLLPSSAARRTPPHKHVQGHVNDAAHTHLTFASVTQLTMSGTAVAGDGDTHPRVPRQSSTRW